MWWSYDRKTITDLYKTPADIPPATPTSLTERCIYFFNTVQISETWFATTVSPSKVSRILPFPIHC